MECEFPKTNATSGEIAQILKTAKTIAVIGASLKPERPSHWISVYLKEHGYSVIPVNPGFCAEIKFFGRHKGGSIRDGVILLVQNIKPCASEPASALCT